ncbi:MAG TPA: TetR family transcriptional regulator [Acidobacteriaceae bacterium]|nr:TetR family transcriptional regulator [Acidobacteriaceae bacterium]
MRNTLLNSLPFVERQNPRSRRGSDNSAANRLFDATIVLCAAEGFQVTVRDIAALAKTNLAAINYYYQSKENLLQQVVEAAVKPINEMMLSQLTAYEDFVGGGRLEVSHVWSALAAPLIRCSMDESSWYADRARIYIRAALHPNSPGPESPFATYTEAIDKRFIKALTLALPKLSPDEVKWTFYFGWGTILTATRDNYDNSRFRRVSKGACNTANLDELLKHLVGFLTNSTCKCPETTRP